MKDKEDTLIDIKEQDLAREKKEFEKGENESEIRNHEEKEKSFVLGFA